MNSMKRSQTVASKMMMKILRKKVTMFQWWWVSNNSILKCLSCHRTFGILGQSPVINAWLLFCWISGSRWHDWREDTRWTQGNKEAHAADEGNFFYLMFSCLVTLAFLLEKTTKCLVFLKLKVYLFQFILSGSYNLYFVGNFSISDMECTCLWKICSFIVLTICCLIFVCCCRVSWWSGYTIGCPSSDTVCKI